MHHHIVKARSPDIFVLTILDVYAKCPKFGEIDYAREVSEET